jgi:hypothetical protein
MAGGADKKPSDFISIPFHHRVKAVFIIAERA